MDYLIAAILALQAATPPPLVGLWDFSAITDETPASLPVAIHLAPSSSAPVVAYLDKEGISLAGGSARSCRWIRDLDASASPRGCIFTESGYEIPSVAEFTMLDDRQYRSDNPCGDGESLRCEAALTGDYTMLGLEQEQWVREGFARSSSQWNIVAQQLLIAQLEHVTIQPDWFWNDAWDGYPLARQRLLDDVAIHSSQIRSFSLATGIRRS